MKRILLALFALTSALTFSSCIKEVYPDYRDDVAGKYTGIRVISSISLNSDPDRNDTTDAIVTITKLPGDSLVSMTYGTSTNGFSFQYIDGKFKPTDPYHAPSLKISNGNLFFVHQPGLGPIWINYYCQKSK